MAIPLSTIVNVGITVSPTPLALAGFGQLLFVSPDANAVILESEVVRVYSSIEGVAGDFPSGEVNAAATAYYAQAPKPLTFMVGGVYGLEAAATLSGGAHDGLVDIQAITTGAFSIDVNGSPVSVSGMDFSGTADFDDVAAILETNITGTTVTYDNGGAAFIITTVATGEAIATLDYATGTDASAFGLSMAENGVLVQGTSIDTPAEALTRIDEVNNTGYGIVLDKVYRDTVEAEAVADWTQARTKVYFNTSNDALSLDIQDTTCIIARLKAKALSRSLSQYSSSPDQYPGASIAGRAFTVNFEGTNTTLTLKFKLQPTITVEDLTPTQLAGLEDKNGNAFMNVGGVSMYSDSRMADGAWFDTIHGTDWLQNRIQVDVFNLLYTSPTKIPYTDEGVNRVVGAVRGGLDQAVRNGLVAPGVTTEGDTLVLGYEVIAVPVGEVSPSDKGNRLYRGISFRAVGAGALHNIVISGTFTS
jgi:hypothetical protein